LFRGAEYQDKQAYDEKMASPEGCQHKPAIFLNHRLCGDRVAGSYLTRRIQLFPNVTGVHFILLGKFPNQNSCSIGRLAHDIGIDGVSCSYPTQIKKKLIMTTPDGNQYKRNPSPVTHW
jgi:hypothetical protein